MICGVDEAGKGAVLGPMVIAGVMVENETFLSGLGLKDSKLLSSRQREGMYQQIISLAETKKISIDAHRIDECRKKMTMNDITARGHAGVIDSLSPSVAYIDACDVNAKRYGNTVQAMLRQDCRIISEHKAETKFLVVAAASIVAKVERDRIIEELSGEYGIIGSGYPSDPVTIRFLESYIKENEQIPIIARSSWNTVNDIKSRLAQSSLEAFI